MNPFDKRQKGSQESNWYVMDMDTGQRAKGSEPNGYPEKSDANTKARELRDKYGAYAKVRF